MEETMSSYSFSHQFYQRWTRAPEPIRAAIIQELTDITSLLQTDTPFEAFVFNAPDLDAHLEALYKTHDTEQAAAKKIADKQAQYRATAEQERLKEQQEKVEKEHKEAQILQETEEVQTKKNKIATNRANINSNSTDNLQDHQDHQDHQNEADDSISNATLTENDNKLADDKARTEDNATNDSHIKALTDKLNQSSVIDLSLKDLKLSAAHESLIHELEIHVDDYLSEQMAQMSENLKSWLRAEVTQQLTAQDSAVDINNKK
ncbi:E3 ubiquitin-protein ligase DOA10 [Psychrobacter sp. PL15]|uniref:hypothetical protein n=1 Tax=unclassified Psychrobacter TaxID=196806 RepID=UPI001AE87842|nr:hypothetical protein [Psychrobacter sp. PL15]MEC5210590.1 E3 ubiquitin-protein ligase DOA10 [Psychrobacter sp. PL15]